MLAEAFTSAAAPTTTVVAAAHDEISAGVAALFTAFGQEYQALGARATAFHEQFVNLLNAGAGAYLSTEAANAELNSLNAVNVSARQGSISAAPTAAGPYQTLFANTATNLQALGSAISANPAPLLHQLISNQTGYAQTIAAEIEYVIQNFPALLANLPANIQAGAQAFLAFNPWPYVQQFVNNQITYAQIIGTSLQNAAIDFVAGLQALPAAFQSAFQALQAGDISGAVSDIAQGFVNLVYTGTDITSLGANTYAVTPTGALGDLAPILTIPGMAAQNFTNLLPAGSIPARISQNFTNVIDAITDTSVTAQITLKFGLQPSYSIVNTIGLPVAIAIDAVGGPVDALAAFGSSTTAFANAVQTGNAAGAIGALVDAPAVVANGFLNGHLTLPVEQTYFGYHAVVNAPLCGILVGPTPYTESLTSPSGGTITVSPGGTPLSGIASALLTFLPEELADALGQ